MRDGTCRITNYVHGTEAAHIIPEGESEWFHSRGMTRRAKIDDESNFLALKVDVHKLWDQRHFTLRVEKAAFERSRKTLS